MEVLVPAALDHKLVIVVAQPALQTPLQERAGATARRACTARALIAGRAILMVGRLAAPVVTVVAHQEVSPQTAVQRSSRVVRAISHLGLRRLKQGTAMQVLVPAALDQKLAVWVVQLAIQVLILERGGENARMASIAGARTARSVILMAGRLAVAVVSVVQFRVVDVTSHRKPTR